MDREQKQDSGSKHPQVREHPEQRRQEETGREDPTEPRDVGRSPSAGGEGQKPERAA
jgi:hypothetical protein